MIVHVSQKTQKEVREKEKEHKCVRGRQRERTEIGRSYMETYTCRELEKPVWATDSDRVGHGEKLPGA